MKSLFALAAALLLAGTLHAQSPGEISFWESVRDSRNPAELRAYLSQYPNGTFKALAESRLAALERSAPSARPAAPASTPPRVAGTAPASVTSATRMPQAGDSWTYRLSYPRLRGQWQDDLLGRRVPSVHVVTIASAADGKIVDQLAVDGGTPVETSHSSAAYLAPQGVSIFSPYLVAFRDLPATRSLGSIAILDTACGGQFRCRASGKVTGTERISVPAGQFLATKIVIEESWQPASSSAIGIQSSQMNGGRTVEVWYVPELKRAAKFSSRITVGDIPPVAPNFDLELVGYQVK
jgi:hypothetical protein